MAGSLPGGALNAIGTALIPETMTRLQMPQLIDQAKREQQVGNIQAGRLLSGADAQIGTPQTKSYQVNGRTIGQDNPSTVAPLFSASKKLGLFSQAFPEQARAAVAQQAMQQLFPQGFSGTVGKNERAYQNGKVVAEGPMDAPEVAKLPAEAELAKWLFGGNEKAAREYLIQKSQPKQDGNWRTLTPGEAQQMNLNPSGSYQVNEKGQIQVITQPKQDAPTETQSKYAYNARRIAGSLSKIDEVLAKDPGASSSWLLDTFAEGPIASRTGMDVAARAKVNPNAQIVRNNMVDAIDAVITLGTGAAYTKEQLEAARATYMPRPGEPPNVKQDKFRKLLEVYEQAKVNARSAGLELPEPAAFQNFFGVEDGTPQAPAGAQNDPLGIRGR